MFRLPCVTKLFSNVSRLGGRTRLYDIGRAGAHILLNSRQSWILICVIEGWYTLLWSHPLQSGLHMSAVSEYHIVPCRPKNVSDLTFVFGVALWWLMKCDDSLCCRHREEKKRGWYVECGIQVRQGAEQRIGGVDCVGARGMSFC